MGAFLMCAKQAAVSDKFLEYAENAAQRLKEKDIRIEVTDRMKCRAAKLGNIANERREKGR